MIAQAILESSSGNSALAQTLFGISSVNFNTLEASSNNNILVLMLVSVNIQILKLH